MQISTWTEAPSLAQAAQAPADNYLVLRHLAALLVIFGHSFDLSQYAAAGDPLARHIPGFTAAGLAVYLFFAISGYLIMLSVLRRRSLWHYLRNRLLRIFPAYLASLLFCVFLLGPLFSLMPAADYLAASGTWQHLADNAIPIGFTWTLPGVFEHNPVPGTINGSLWSLGLELRWYFYLGLLLLLGAAVSRPWFSLIALAFIVFSGWQWWQGRPDPLHFRALSMLFMSAALAAHWRHRLRISHAGMLICALMCLLSLSSPGFGPMLSLSLLYFSWWFSYRLPPMPWPVHRDYSFGLFLYGFPVQQALLSINGELLPLQLFALALAPTALLAWLSWHAIEVPFMRHFRRRKESADLTTPVKA